MNKFQKELLEKCKHIGIDEETPLFNDIYILPTTRKHESGYKIMYVVGLDRKNNQYYLLDTFCDVVNIGNFIKSLKGIDIDILDNGIIHLWNNYQLFKSIYRVSSCTFDLVERR